MINRLSVTTPSNSIIITIQEAATGHSRSDRALGHLLVLLQYDWPKEEEMFAHVITMIQKRRKFSFPEFFKYVISILRVDDRAIQSTSSTVKQLV